MKNRLFPLLALLLSFASSLAQNGSIKGSITDNTQTPILGVNILIKNSTQGVQSNENGIFEITNVENGDYTLIISYLGFKTKEIPFSILNNETSTLDTIILYEGNELLTEVVVVGERRNKFSRKKTAYVSKLPLKDLENSQVYSTITNEILVSQSVTTFSEALQNAVGVDQLWPSTGRSGDGAGYYSLRGFSIQPKLVNGIAGITNGFINPSNVERIEVIKGPSATLFGNSVSSYGGLINIVTKKPYNGTGGNISVAGGSFNFKKATIDLNVTDKASEKFSLRFNAGFQSQDSWQDAGFNESVFMAPAISYKVNNKLTLNLSLEASNTEQTNAVFLFLNRSAPLAFNNLEELNYDYNKSLTDDSVTIKNPTHNYRGEIAYKITDNWSSQTIFSGGSAKSKGYYSYLWNAADWSSGTPQPTPNFALYAQRTDAKTNTLNLQQNFIGDFKLASVRNRIVIGADYLESQIIDNGSGYGLVQGVNAQGQVLQGLPINNNSIEAVISGTQNSNTDTNQNFLGIYASDVINILPKLSLALGVRYDRFNYKGDKNNLADDEKEYIKSTFSPKFGVVYQPILNKLSVFANYQNGYTYVNPEIIPVNSADPTAGTTLQSYDLEKANQFEIGIKSNLFNNKVDATINYYNITVDDKVMGYGASKQQDGTVKSKGVELELHSNPIGGLNIKGGASYNDAEVTKSLSRPDLIGKRFEQAGPEVSYNFWADYKFQNGFIKNFGLGAGFNGASKYNTVSGYPNIGEFYLPAYTLFNASAYYDINKVRISVKANNLTDKQYYKGWSTITPQRTRSIIATVTYKF